MLPRVGHQQYGNALLGDLCLELKDYCDGGGGPNPKLTTICNYRAPPPPFDQGGADKCRYEKGAIPGRTCVKIERYDPANQKTKLWTFDPFTNASWDGDPVRHITKQTRVYFSAERVGVAYTNEPCPPDGHDMCP